MVTCCTRYFWLQFKDWKWSNPAELFQQVLGVHLTMDEQTVPVEVERWNCRVLKINQFKRHLDSGACNEFWALLDTFVKLRKPWLSQSQPQPAPPRLQAPVARKDHFPQVAEGWGRGICRILLLFYFPHRYGRLGSWRLCLDPQVRNHCCVFSPLFSFLCFILIG